MPELDEYHIKLEARLRAYEYLLTRLYVASLARTPDPVASAEALDSACQQAAERQSFPGLDPALGDVFADEVQQELRQFVSGVKELLEKRQS